jgi:hypothetical protein
MKLKFFIVLAFPSPLDYIIGYKTGIIDQFVSGEKSNSYCLPGVTVCNFVANF